MIEKLDLESFNSRFDELMSKTEHSFLKYESLQYYEEELYSYYINGQSELLTKAIISMFNSESVNLTKYIDKGVVFSRIHSICFPISDYLKFEYYVYACWEKIGEKIYYIDSNSIPSKYSDFVLFDEKYLLIHDYNNKGRLLGATYIDDIDIVNDYVKFYRDTMKVAKPFHEYYVSPDFDFITELLNKID